MRTRYLFAALKNRLDPPQAVALTLAVRDAVRPNGDRVVGLSPSGAALAWASSCRGELALAAQSCGWDAPYALTGELTVRDLQVFSAAYCLVGHSERRLYLGETEAMITHRLGALLSGGIIPILCVGETLEQHRGHDSVAAIRAQLTSLRSAHEGTKVPPDPARIIVAYEPMWAISTSGAKLEAVPSDAVAMHGAIRAELDALFGSGFGAATSVLFGGGVESDNAATYLDQPQIDGALVGAGMETASGFLGVLAAFYGGGPRQRQDG